MMRRQIFVCCSLCVFVLLSFFVGPATASQYEVKKGDSLYTISREFGISISDIRAANHLQGSALKPKQILNVPASAADAKSSPAQTKKHSKPATSYYSVKQGDTLSAIASKTGTSVKQIMALNNVNAKNLRIGRKLTLSKTYKSASKEPLSDDEGALDDEEEGEDDAIALTDKTDELEREKKAAEALLGQWHSPDERKLFIKVATGFLGAPYRLGGSTVKGIDCSAFVRKMYDFFDISLPRTAREQSTCGVSIDRKELEEGDLVFFRTRRPIGHVGIYIGNNEFVHASYKNKAVRIDSLDTPYFQKRFQRAVRLKGLNNTGGA